MRSRLDLFEFKYKGPFLVKGEEWKGEEWVWERNIFKYSVKSRKKHLCNAKLRLSMVRCQLSQGMITRAFVDHFLKSVVNFILQLGIFW